MGEKIGGGGDGQRRRLPARVIWATDCSSAAKALGAGIQDLADFGQADALRAALAHRHSSTDSSSDLVADRRRYLTPSASAASLKLRQPATAWKARSAQRRQTGFSHG